MCEEIETVLRRLRTGKKYILIKNFFEVSRLLTKSIFICFKFLGVNVLIYDILITLRIRGA